MNRAMVCALVLAAGVSGLAGNMNPDTDWMHDGKVGVFMHYLVDARGFAALDKFDVEGLADQLAEVHAAWFCLTLGQNGGWYLGPNATYERLTGYPPGTRCSQRDIPLALGRALKKRGIRLMLYLPCQTPNQDAKAVAAFGLPSGPVNGDRRISRAFAAAWAQVIGDWSRHYGDLVSGWWFDGGYKSVGFTEADAALYAAAARQGNPHAVVAMNAGVFLGRGKAVDDYTAGEQNDPFGQTCGGRWLDGAQWHVLTYLGGDWSQRSTRRKDADWLTWVRAVTSKGGAVTLDVSPCLPDGSLDPRGHIYADHVRQLKVLVAGVRAAGNR